MSKRRRFRSDEQLAHGASGTRYGFAQLLHCGAVLSGNGAMTIAAPDPALAHEVVTNALVESFLTNARRIGWFLHEALAGDAYAGDFLPAGKWDDWPTADPVVDLASNHLSHSKYIPKPDPYRWRTLMTPLVEGMGEFVERLRAEDSRWLSTFEPLIDLASGMLLFVSDVDRSRPAPSPFDT